MDTIYSNKKYLQNLSAADYYRTSTMRPATNEYASYHNTMSRRSLFGSHYSHQQPQQQQQPNISKYKYSYPSDVSLSSHYGYTSWGLWRETGHLSPSVYSKKRINIRSFSILIMSAAFIVLLAVLSVAGLAFYFSTFKSDPSDSMLVFDCAFRIGKGDIWTSQLKYNHTPAFRQKAAFYTKFIETSLEHGNFNVAKTEINSFGTGPELLLSFRIYLDMRKIQMTITNVEEHIKNALISGTAGTDSTYRNLKIDIDSIEIKRQLDPDVLQKAAFIHEQSQDLLTTLMPTTVIPLDDLPKKSGVTTDKPKSFKSSAATASGGLKGGRIKNTQRPIQESDIDMENLPVIQGSFEITKTDADIAQKRSSAASRPASTTTAANTLKPFHISPASSIKVKASGQQPTPTATPKTTTDNIVEMFVQHQKNLQQKTITKESPVTAKIEKTNKSGETTASTVKMTTQRESTTAAPQAVGESQINKDLPKLDVSLFTSAPILDNEPWRPINPSPDQIKMTNLPSTPSEIGAASSQPSPTATTEMPIYRSPFNPPPTNENVIYRNKFVDPVDTAYDTNAANDSSDESVFYQSFYNADFSAGSLEIEKLGTGDVRPYPLPVNKIDVSDEEKEAAAQRPASEILSDNKKLVIDTANYDENKFEHLGGGVIAKKQDVASSSSNSSIEAQNSTASDNYQNATETATTTAAKITVSPNEKDNNKNNDDDDDDEDSDTATSFDDIFQELLDSNDLHNRTDVLESRTAPEDDDNAENGENSEQSENESEEMATTTQRLNFMNMKTFIMQMQHNKSDDNSAENSTEIVSTSDAAKTTLTTFDAVKGTPPSVTSTLAEPQLFPSPSKWEFVNGTRANISELSVTKKVFNETLQAVIVENVQTTTQPSGAKQRLDDLKGNQTLDKGNLQQLSSIFDTLAAKLGIRTDVSSKVPPFSQNIQTKLKQGAGTQVRSSTRKNTSTTLPVRPATTTATPKTAKTTKKSKVTTTITTTTTASTTTERIEPTRGLEMSSESFLGQAEVEAVDPTQYEEILSMASSPLTRITSTTPSLVTLLPVKSNSGIRNFNPRLRLASASASSASETRGMETVVKASMSFDA